jgi:hypothetical protein
VLKASDGSRVGRFVYTSRFSSFRRPGYLIHLSDVRILDTCNLGGRHRQRQGCLTSVCSFNRWVNVEATAAAPSLIEISRDRLFNLVSPFCRREVTDTPR